ncbi:MAG: class 3 adenylate cyclase [Candidatus Latescibacterota bacterium]
MKPWNGSFLKTIGDAIMAIFTNPLDGIHAALEILVEIEKLNQKIGDEIILKIGVDCGPPIAVTLNEKIDYFGQTVNAAARIQGIAKENDIVISQDVYRYQGVEELLKERIVDHSKE